MNEAQRRLEVEMRNDEALQEFRYRMVRHHKGYRFPDLRSDDQADAGVALEWRRRVAGHFLDGLEFGRRFGRKLQ